MNLTVRAGLYFPLVFVVEEDCLRLALGLTLPVLLGHCFSLDPGLKPNVEFPATFLELQGSKILLVSALHVIKGKEEALDIKSLEV